MFNTIREIVEEKNNEHKLTPQEWADMSAAAIANKNKEVVDNMISRLEESQRKTNLINEYKYWRKVFAAAAIQSGASCEDSVLIADEMLGRLGVSNQENN